MKKNKSLVVVNKMTYLFLLSIPLAILYVIYDCIKTFNGQNNPDLGNFITRMFLVVLVVVICVNFFVKFNTYSHWMNPNHPKSKDEMK